MAVTVHCWASRYEAEGFDTCSAWFLAQEGSDVRWEDGHMTCLLPDGHEGPHDYVSLESLVIEFKDAPDADLG